MDVCVCVCVCGVWCVCMVMCTVPATFAQTLRQYFFRKQRTGEQSTNAQQWAASNAATRARTSEEVWGMQQGGRWGGHDKICEIMNKLPCAQHSTFAELLLLPLLMELSILLSPVCHGLCSCFLLRLATRQT